MSDSSDDAHHVECNLATLLDDKRMALVQLAALTGVTVANLSVLKNGRARAIRFSTLTAICHALQCQPGDLLAVNINIRAAAATSRPSYSSRLRALCGA